jgi:hypothetical protein
MRFNAFSHIVFALHEQDTLVGRFVLVSIIQIYIGKRQIKSRVLIF